MKFKEIVKIIESRDAVWCYRKGNKYYIQDIATGGILKVFNSLVEIEEYVIND